MTATRTSADIRTLYDTEYYLRVCGSPLEAEGFGSGDLSRRLRDALMLAQLDGSEEVLDVGCGRGEVVAEAARLGCRALGVDYSADAVALAKRQVANRPWANRCEFLVGDVTRLDLNRRFDVVFALDVLEHLHLEELGRLLRWTARRLKPGGRLVFHTSPNRNFYTVAYRTVRWLSLVWGRKSLPAEARCAFEQRMHLSELTGAEIGELMVEAGLACDLKRYGLERILEAVREGGFPRRMADLLGSFACSPALRAIANSDLIGVASPDRSVLDEAARLPVAGSIALDHPVFFHEGWYVPVTDEDSPHRWSSPHFSLRGWCDRPARIDLVLARQPGPPPRIVDKPHKGFKLLVTEEARAYRLSLLWPPTPRPAVVHLRTPPLPRVAEDPRRFGIYLQEAMRR